MVLPAAARSEQLLEDERTLAYLVLVPAEAQVVVECAQYVGGQYAARAQSRSGGNGGEQGDFKTTAHVLELCVQRRVADVGEHGMEAAQHECRLGNGEGVAHMVEVGYLVIGCHCL